MGWRGAEGTGEIVIQMSALISPDGIKVVLGILAAGSLLVSTGCSVLQEIAEEYKAEQAAAEAKKNRIRTP